MRISDWSSDVCSSDLSVIWAISMGGFLQDQKIVGGDLQADRLAMGEVAPLDAFGDQRLRLADLDEQPGAVAEEEGGRDAIGRASCRDRVCQYVYVSVVAVPFKKITDKNQLIHI